MRNSESPAPIRPEDIRSRSIERRTFLGRFGAIAGVAGLLGYTAGCENSGQCDSDQGDAIMYDSDGTDEPIADSDYADPCKTQK